MRRSLYAALSGGLFGAGLMVSGMTDTAKVQGFLDVLGAWDPTLAFVMAGAILPMAFAWRRAGETQPRLGGAMPALPPQRITGPLVVGSVLFGIGWGLVGLCPGPALASIGFGGPGVWVFAAAMLLGMAAAPGIGARLDLRERSG